MALLGGRAGRWEKAVARSSASSEKVKHLPDFETVVQTGSLQKCFIWHTNLKTFFFEPTFKNREISVNTLDFQFF